MLQAAEDAGDNTSAGSAHSSSPSAPPSRRRSSGTVAELEAICGQLADDTAQLRDELEERAEDYPDYYEAPRAALSQCI